LRVPRGARPAAERVRLAIFSSLGRLVEGARVLDLYCGSGAYGLEALSRGASDAVFVDSAPAAIAAVRANIEATGFGDRCTVRRRPVERYDPAPDGPFDLVFADPPYGVLPVLPTSGVTEHATVVVEARWQDAPPPAAKGYVLEADRRYGDTRVLVYRRGPVPEDR
jgi:16S rRNA (guanine966-N2)-methyltransferase